MTERLNTHLTDEALNEYLDDALEGPERSAATAHLAGCALCSSRLNELHALFAGLESLPEAPLKRNLGPGVMAVVRARQPAVLRPVGDPRRPAFKLAFALQGGIALALLAFAWPFLLSLALPVPPIVAGDLTGLAAQFANAWVDPNRLWPALQSWIASVTAPLALPPLTVLQPLAAGLLLAAAGLFWLAGNALLLRARPTARLRRNP